MPKNPEESKKTRVSLTTDNSVISLKSKSQPLTNHEMITLNKIYNESVVRLARTLELINNLEHYLSTKDNKVNRINIKQLLIEANADPDILHTLKMIKRHFYIEITHISINHVLGYIDRLRNNVLKTLRGLEGQLDITLQICQGKPTDSFIENNFKDKTYVLIYQDGSVKLDYYENKVKKNEVVIDEVDLQIKNMTWDAATTDISRHCILESVMLYHAKHVHSTPDKVYISNISLKRQHNAKNIEKGYVHHDDFDNNARYGAIHLDYRLLQNCSYTALIVLIHESFHRYAWVNDKGYYLGTKAVKNNSKPRPYPNELQKKPSSALDNADSYAFFVCDMTDPGSVYTNNNTPAWCNQEQYKRKHKPLPEGYRPRSHFLNKFSMFAISIGTAALVAGGTYYFTMHKQSNAIR